MATFRGLAGGARVAVVLVACVFAQACGTIPLGEPQASIENLEIARQAQIGKIDVGVFVRAAALSAARDAEHGLRSHDVVAPGGSFASYLGRTLKAELIGAGAYEAGAPMQVRGQLLDSQLDGSGARVGTARLAARFEVGRDQVVLYRREFQVADRWDSAFMGVEAIPAAVNHYEQLYRRLVGLLLADPAFAAATR